MRNTRTRTRTFHVTVKSRTMPDAAVHMQTARQGLKETATLEGYVLTDEPRMMSTSWDESHHLHAMTFSAEGRRVVAPWVTSRMGPHTLLLRAHRSTLHGFQVTCGHVNDALATCDPAAALVALHLLGCPTYPDPSLDDAEPLNLARQVEIGAEVCAALWGQPQKAGCEGGEPT